MLERLKKAFLMLTGHSENTVANNLKRWSNWDWSRYGEEWSNNEVWKMSLVNDVLYRYMPKSGTILEIGPGGGRWTEYLLPRASRLILVDVTEGCIEICRKRFKDQDNIEYHVNDGKDLSFLPDSCIDAIWSWDVFVHIRSSDVEKYIQQFSRVLKNGGSAVIHHSKNGISRTGWRSDMTDKKMIEFCEYCGLHVDRQFEQWQDGKQRIVNRMRCKGKMPKVSVIIPCFNQGIYIEEAVDSVLHQTFSDFEIIVVNDGSDDAETVNILDNFDRPKTRVIHTPNNGLPAARNKGIAHARSPYILPLDADDKIGARYLELGISILDESPRVGIVYSNADRFGAVTGPWSLPEFSPAKLCFENMIFCSALFRKNDWEQVGGYNTKMKYGWEDWDFWLSLVERGRCVARIPELLFHYRVIGNSMTRRMAYWQKMSMMARLLIGHHQYYVKNAKFVLQYILGK
jgi:GT2 family glycosyltransferase/ubiquinone/menaquinone biosynthesis C-methylase UbiE